MADSPQELKGVVRFNNSPYSERLTILVKDEKDAVWHFYWPKWEGAVDGQKVALQLKISPLDTEEEKGRQETEETDRPIEGRGR